MKRGIRHEKFLAFCEEQLANGKIDPKHTLFVRLYLWLGSTQKVRVAIAHMDTARGAIIHTGWRPTGRKNRWGSDEIEQAEELTEIPQDILAEIRAEEKSKKTHYGLTFPTNERIRLISNLHQQCLTSGDSEAAEIVRLIEEKEQELAKLKERFKQLKRYAPHGNR